MNLFEFDEYFKQMKTHCGLIADLTKRLEAVSPQFGKTVLQKMVFLLQEVYGVDAKYSFSFHTFGPFAPELLGDLDMAESYGAVVVKSVNDGCGHGYVIESGARVKECMADAEGFLKANSTQIENLVSAFGGKTAKELELLTTIIYLNKEIKFDTDKMTRNAAIGKIRELKPKFTEKEIRDGMSKLESAHKITLVFQ